MSRLCLPLLAAASLTLAGCSTISDTVDKINPFASSAPKMSVLPQITPSIAVREQWSASVGKAGDYTFQPAVVGRAVYVAGRDGTVSKLADGRTSGRSRQVSPCRPVSVPIPAWWWSVRPRATCSLFRLMTGVLCGSPR